MKEEDESDRSDSKKEELITKDGENDEKKRLTLK